MTTGERIRTRRKQLGMSVDDLAAKLGKNRATIYRYESDAIEMPASLLKPLADALDTVPDELMDWGSLLIKDGYLLYMIIIFVSFSAVAVSIQTGRYSLRQADSVSAQEFYDYVNENIRDDEVIYFFKPRVLYLYTNVYSYNWYDEVDHMDAADYIAVCEEDGYNRVHEYAKEHGTLVYENEMFRLYEL